MTRAKKPFLDVVAEALNLKKLRVVETGGGSYATERQQWVSGNNLVAVSPGVVVAYDRNTHTTLLRKQGIEGITIVGAESQAWPRRWPLHDLPADPRSRRPLTPPAQAGFGLRFEDAIAAKGIERGRG